MTLIAIACYDDRVEYMTDSISYNRNVTSIGYCTKAMTLPHLTAAVLGQGDGDFCFLARVAVIQHSAAVKHFDELCGDITELLRGVSKIEPPKSGMDATIFLTGYSPTQARFVAYGYDSVTNYEPFSIEDLFVIPSPWTIHPSSLELQRFTTSSTPDSATDDARIIELWTKKPLGQTPPDRATWLDLANNVRNQRALGNVPGKTLVGGGVFHTTLRRGSTRTVELMTYDDNGPERARLLEATQHPDNQHADCPCGSGKTYLDCHLTDWYADGHTCDCGSGEPFTECCRVGGDTTLSDPH